VLPPLFTAPETVRVFPEAMLQVLFAVRLTIEPMVPLLLRCC